MIYADFSAYSDIAIGIALLLGFRFPENFDRPYRAISLRDFWRRWHMTLSRWLRDYLYIPLGGSRHGEVRTAVNIMITMLLGGLWHGAGWTFVAWGTLHGIGQVVGRWRTRRRRSTGDGEPTTAWVLARRRLVTFHLVCLAWVFFRADSTATAFEILGRLGTRGSTELVTPLVLLAIGGMLPIQVAPADPFARARERFGRLSPSLQGAALAACLFAVTTLGTRGVTPFIYFQF